MTKEEAIKWLQEEKLSLERAPDLNGCPMTEDWKKGIDVYDMAISALRSQQSKGVEIDQVKNDPLTLDELREMDGEPVWVRHRHGGEWVIAHWNALDVIVGSLKDVLFKHEYGETWLAYRSKKEV